MEGATQVVNFEVCALTHIVLRMFITQVLASQLHFLANRNAKLAVPPLFRSVNCIKIRGHVALLSCPSIYFLFYGNMQQRKRKHGLIYHVAGTCQATTLNFTLVQL